MTRRQREAVAWLESVGKATTGLVLWAGFSPRTFDILADAGQIQREYRPRTVGGLFPVYRPLADSDARQEAAS